MMDDCWIGKFRTVTVTGADRVWKPAEFPSAASRTPQPVTVVPSERLSGKSSVVLLGTSWPRGAVNGHMSFIDGVEISCCRTNQQPRQSRGHGGSNQECPSDLSSNCVEVEHRECVLKVVTARHDAHAGINEPS
jgi:hypothetical protein